MLKKKQLELENKKQEINDIQSEITAIIKNLANKNNELSEKQIELSKIKTESLLKMSELQKNNKMLAIEILELEKIIDMKKMEFKKNTEEIQNIQSLTSINNIETTKTIDIESNIDSNIKYNKSKLKISNMLRLEVWTMYNGRNFDGKCYVCDKIIFFENFECDHIIAEADGGYTILENLRPICKYCNVHCGTTNMDEYKLYITNIKKQYNDKIKK